MSVLPQKTIKLGDKVFVETVSGFKFILDIDDKKGKKFKKLNINNGELVGRPYYQWFSIDPVTSSIIETSHPVFDTQSLLSNENEEEETPTSMKKKRKKMMRSNFFRIIPYTMLSLFSRSVKKQGEIKNLKTNLDLGSISYLINLLDLKQEGVYGIFEEPAYILTHAVSEILAGNSLIVGLRVQGNGQPFKDNRYSNVEVLEYHNLLEDQPEITVHGEPDDHVSTRKLKRKQLVDTVRTLGFSSLSFTSDRYDAVDFVKSFSSLLRPNGVLVLYSKLRQNMINAFSYLLKSKNWIDIEMCEVALRVYQTVSNGVHPFMDGGMGNGWCVSAIYVIDEQAEPQE